MVTKEIKTVDITLTGSPTYDSVTGLTGSTIARLTHLSVINASTANDAYVKIGTGDAFPIPNNSSGTAEATLHDDKDHPMLIDSSHAITVSGTAGQTVYVKFTRVEL